MRPEQKVGWVLTHPVELRQVALEGVWKVEELSLPLAHNYSALLVARSASLLYTPSAACLSGFSGPPTTSSWCWPSADSALSPGL
jgi:hypothetical protein